MGNKDFLEVYEDLRDSLSVSVKIDYNEVCKIVIQDLIAKRNSVTNKNRPEFDVVLKYYLGEKGFKELKENNWTKCPLEK